MKDVSEDVAVAMSGQKDYYQLLGLGPGASEDEIKKAYRKKSLQHHPDKVAQFAKTQNKSPEEINHNSMWFNFIYS